MLSLCSGSSLNYPGGDILVINSILPLFACAEAIVEIAEPCTSLAYSTLLYMPVSEVQHVQHGMCSDCHSTVHVQFPKYHHADCIVFIMHLYISINTSLHKSCLYI